MQHERLPHVGTRYYIDGYNVLHKSQAMRPLLKTSLESAREALIDRVAQFCIATSHEAILVFDGRTAHLAAESEHYRGVGNLTVIYAPAQHSADTEIERRVYQERDRLGVVVVSNDRGLRDLCRGMGALTMEADSFLASTRETRREMGEVLERTRKNRPAFLEDGLSDRDREALLRLKKKLK